MSIKINCFVSYSHDDTTIKNEFVDNLSDFFREINIWSDSKLNPGQNWFYTIHKNLEESNIIFCLLSDNFLKSVPCNDELNRAIQCYRNGTGEVIPLFLRMDDMDLTKNNLQNLHFCPTENGRIKPICEWPTTLDGFRNAFLQIRPVIDKLLKKLQVKDPAWRFDIIQNLISEGKFNEGLKELLGYTREFCPENKIAQNKVCRSMSMLSLLENKIKENPGDIIEKLDKLLEVMDVVSNECGC